MSQRTVTEGKRYEQARDLVGVLVEKTLSVRESKVLEVDNCKIEYNLGLVGNRAREVRREERLARIGLEERKRDSSQR